MRRLSFCTLLAILFTFTASAETIVGWRGDGSGCYPDATPPVTWGRVSKAVKGLRFQVQKPGAEASGKSMEDGVVREWLVLGPVPVPDVPKAIEKETLPGEFQFAPEENDKVESLTWKKVQAATSTLDFAKILGYQKKMYAYAFTNIYSDNGGEFTLNYTHRLAGRAIVNGKPIYASEGTSGSRVKLNLAKGWNRLLLKISSDDVAQWWASPIVFAHTPGGYEETNITWKTPLPGTRIYSHTPCGNGGPIIVGDKIFMEVEPSELFCLNKSDGKVLWVRSNHYFDALTEAEKSANPAFKEIEPMAAKWSAMNEEFVAGAVKTPFEQREKVEKDLHLALKKIDRQRFTRPDSQDVGYAGFTPASDGKFVYAWFASGVTACYDLDGNRKWIRIDNHETVEHGFSSSPILVGSTLVVFMRDLMAFDAATGKEKWRDPIVGPGGMNPEGFFHGSFAHTRLGDVDVVIPSNIGIFRVSDGKRLYFDQKTANKQVVATPVINDGQLSMMSTFSDMFYNVLLPKAPAESVTVTNAFEIKIQTAQFPFYYLNWHTASPLVHEGLIYLMNNAGVLTVLDQKTGTLVYQKPLDLDHFEGANEGPARGHGVSPILAGKHIYFFGNSGACVVIEPGREFKQVAKNKIEGLAVPGTWGERFERTVANPIADGKRLYYRSEFGLYAIEGK